VYKNNPILFHHKTGDTIGETKKKKKKTFWISGCNCGGYEEFNLLESNSA
jgi:hypothetical protein